MAVVHVHRVRFSAVFENGEFVNNGIEWEENQDSYVIQQDSSLMNRSEAQSFQLKPPSFPTATHQAFPALEIFFPRPIISPD